MDAPSGMSVSDAIRSRRSHRHFRSDSIPPHILGRLVELALEAPSAWNYQGRSIVVVSDLGGRLGLEAATGGQPHPREAPVVLVFLAELDAWLGRYRRFWTQRLDALDTEIRRGRKDRRTAR